MAKVYVIGKDGTLFKTCSNKTRAWGRISEAIEGEEVGISYLNPDGDTINLKGTYPNFTKAFKNADKVIVHATVHDDEEDEDFYNIMPVWETIVNE